MLTYSIFATTVMASFNSYAMEFLLPTQFNGFPPSLCKSLQPEVNPQDREDEVDASSPGSSPFLLVDST
jgi:hypothetical protein